MPWTETTRPHYDRRALRYASDCTDGEWALIEPFMPPRSRVGRPRRTDMRSVRDAIQYIAATGCQWAMLPKDFPPFTTVQYHFYRIRDSGLLDVINEALTGAVRLLNGRNAEPTAGIIDSQSVKTTESGGPKGYDAGKKTKGRKRHIVTDTDGSLLALTTHTGDIQDRDGGPDVIRDACDSFPALACIFADGGYSGDGVRDAVEAFDGPVIEVVKRPAGVTGFVVIARRWVVCLFRCLGAHRINPTISPLRRKKNGHRILSQTLSSMKTKNLVLLLSLFGLSACASGSVAPPVKRDIAKTSNIALPYDQAWRRSVAWFAGQNIVIDKIEKESGLITAKYTLAVGDGIVDCGSISMTGVLGDPDIERLANVNVTLSPAGGNATTVSMNVFGEFEASALDAWDARRVTMNGKCSSTGQLEKAFMNAVAG